MTGFSSGFLLSQSYPVFKGKPKCRRPRKPFLMTWHREASMTTPYGVSRLQLVMTSPYVFEVGFVVILQMRGGD